MSDREKLAVGDTVNGWVYRGISIDNKPTWSLLGCRPLYFYYGDNPPGSLDDRPDTGGEDSK